LHPHNHVFSYINVIVNGWRSCTLVFELLSWTYWKLQRFNKNMWGCKRNLWRFQGKLQVIFQHKSCWFVTWILLLKSWISLVVSSRHSLFWLEMGQNYMKHGPSPKLGHLKPRFHKLWVLKPKFSKCGPLKVRSLKH